MGFKKKRTSRGSTTRESREAKEHGSAALDEAATASSALGCGGDDMNERVGPQGCTWRWCRGQSSLVARWRRAVEADDASEGGDNEQAEEGGVYGTHEHQGVEGVSPVCLALVGM